MKAKRKPQKKAVKEKTREVHYDEIE